MRWPIFALFAYLALALETGGRGLLEIGGSAPSFTLILLAFIALSAPHRVVMWAALALGLLVDLQPVAVSVPAARDVVVIGPAALGYLAGSLAAIQLRGFVFRDSPITVAVAAVFAGLFAHLVIVALLTFRGLPWLLGQPLEGWNAADQLLARAFDVFYTALAALPVGWLLIRCDPLWGFPTVKGTAIRRY